jgi:membrane-associated protease RseP (regulator of RpoE activity)
MIVVRLDGEHGGVNWSDKEDNVFQFEPGEKRQMIFMPGSSAKFVLGVALEPISDLVRSQLKIDEQVGIGVVSVIEDSPAAQAGLQKYDVIVKANGSNIRELQDLIGPIERAGERQKALKLTLIRAGERLSVKVSPQSAAHGHESHDEHENENEHEFDSEIKVLKKQLQELRAVVEELKRAG